MSYECTSFLKWALPQLQLRWEGFRKVRRQVCKRLNKRILELSLENLEEYRIYLQNNHQEWILLDKMCQITISRFFRDRGVFKYIKENLIPELARRVGDQGRVLRVWCAGCASGEEPYSIALILEDYITNENEEFQYEVLATDARETVLERARKGIYGRSSLRDLPKDLFEGYFKKKGDDYQINNEMTEHVLFEKENLRDSMPDIHFDLIFCRNLVFTYYERQLQETILSDIMEHMIPGSFLILGSHEELPLIDNREPLEYVAPCIYRKAIDFL